MARTWLDGPMTMEPETQAMVRHYDGLAASAKDGARRQIANIQRQLVALQTALDEDMQPSTDVTGSLGLERNVMDLQRHVDGWLSAAQSLRVIENVLEG